MSATAKRCPPRLTAQDRIRFHTAIDPVCGCWNWQAKIDRDGYGHTKIDTRYMLAHRAAYEAFVGPIAPGHEIDHLCRNRACCNPAHLEVVTKRENVLRSDNRAGINSRKTHCIRGHEFTLENTHHYRGERVCRACWRQ